MFPILKATKQSISMRKPVFGVGINDADYEVSPVVNGKREICPFYRAWANMLKRCYHQKSLEKRPTYKDCTVCQEWLLFSNFKAWMKCQKWQYHHLDKDLRQINNKTYSPQTCSFVPHRINGLLSDSAAIRGKYYQGVDYRESNDTFRARCKDGPGGSRYIGHFDTELKAYQAYLRRKAQVIRKAVKEFAAELHPEVINSLHLRANQNIYLAYYL